VRRWIWLKPWRVSIGGPVPAGSTSPEDQRRDSAGPCRDREPGTLFLQVEWRLVKAALVGEEITGLVEVISIRDDKPICKLRTEIRSQP
jgi:hypothetical protein